MRKKGIGAVLAPLVLLAALWLTALPAYGAEVVASGTDGDLQWSLDDAGVLTISGNGAMNGKPWLEEHGEQIREVVVEEGVTSVGTSAFSG